MSCNCGNRKNKRSMYASEEIIKARLLICGGCKEFVRDNCRLMPGLVLVEEVKKIQSPCPLSQHQ